MILHCGEALIDMIPTADNYRAVPGGSPYNTALSTARLGAASYFAGSFSKDFFGTLLADHLHSSGVDLSYSAFSSLQTPLAFVHLSSQGVPQYSFYFKNTSGFSFDSDVKNCDLPPGIIQFGSVSFLFPSWGDEFLPFIRERKNSHLLSYDPNLRFTLIDDEDDARQRVQQAIELSHIIKLNEEELKWIYGFSDEKQAFSLLQKKNVSLICLTRGEKGLMVQNHLHCVQVPGKSITIQDTVGAGDSCHGALLAWLDERKIHSPEEIETLSEKDLLSLAQLACEVSASTCLRRGADPPLRGDLLYYRKER